MRILIVEDDELKHSHIEKFIKDQYPDAYVNWKRSYHSGLDEILTNEYDLILLDMSMHIYERTAQETGGSFETYAGRLILSEIELNEIDTKVIVITGYDVYGDGKTIDMLKAELRSDFGDFYLDTVYFVSNQDNWKRQLKTILTSNWDIHE